MSWSSEEERLAALQRVRELATFGTQPEGPVTQGETSAPPVSTGVSDDELLSLNYTAEPYTLANGRKLWVHPCSIDEIRWFNRQAWREVAPLGLSDDTALKLEFTFAAQVWQAVACLRVGPEPTAAKALKESQAKILRCNAGWLPDVQAICRISDGLTGGQSEAERMKAVLRGFFTNAESCCAMLSSLCETASPEELQPLLADFAGSVSSVKSLLNLG